MTTKLLLTIEVRSGEQDGGYVALVREMPGVGSQGETVAEALTNVADAILEAAAVRATPPEPDPAPRDLIAAWLAGYWNNPGGIRDMERDEADNLIAHLEAAGWHITQPPGGELA